MWAGEGMCEHAYNQTCAVLSHVCIHDHHRAFHPFTAAATSFLSLVLTAPLSVRLSLENVVQMDHTVGTFGNCLSSLS